MKLTEQLRIIFNELFEVAGFDDKTKNGMVQDVLDVWGVLTLGKIVELLTQQEKDELTQITTVNKNSSLETLENILSKLDEVRKEKAMEAAYKEASDISGRMIEKFNIKSTPEQKEEFAKRLSKAIDEH